MTNVEFREATDSAATAGNPAPANATTQANRAQSAPPSSVPSADDAPLSASMAEMLAAARRYCSECHLSEMFGHDSGCSKMNEYPMDSSAEAEDAR